MEWRRMKEIHIYVKGVLIVFCLSLLDLYGSCKADELSGFRRKQMQDSLLAVSQETKDTGKKIKALQELCKLIGRLRWKCPI